MAEVENHITTKVIQDLYPLVQVAKILRCSRVGVSLDLQRKVKSRSLGPQLQVPTRGHSAIRARVGYSFEES